MGAKKNDDLRIAMRRNEVSRLFRRGMRDQVEIARSLSESGEYGNVSQPTVSRDLDFILRTVREQAGVEIGLLRDALQQEIYEVKREAWEAWEKSKEEKETFKDRSPQYARIERGQDDPEGLIDQALRKTGADDGYVLSTNYEYTLEKRDPNGKFLDIVLNCIKQERELLCLDKPLQTPADDGSTCIELSFHGMSDTELAAMEVMVKQGDKEALMRFISMKTRE